MAEGMSSAKAREQLSVVLGAWCRPHMSFSAIPKQTG